MTLRDTLRHAFAVDPPGPAEPTAAQQPAVDWVCAEVARRGMGTASLVGLELARPLNFVAAQAMHFASPAVWALARKMTFEHFQHFVAFLERRGSIEYMARRIEHFEAEPAQAERESEDDGQA